MAGVWGTCPRVRSWVRQCTNIVGNCELIWVCQHIIAEPWVAHEVDFQVQWQPRLPWSTTKAGVPLPALEQLLGDHLLQQEHHILAGSSLGVVTKLISLSLADSLQGNVGTKVLLLNTNSIETPLL